MGRVGDQMNTPRHDPDGGWGYEPGFVHDPDSVFVALRDELVWTSQMRSRDTASMGIPYNYAGASYPEAPFHPVVSELAAQVKERLGFASTNALLNRYPTGEHTIGWHVDDVDILAPGTGIAILSFGGTRTMLLRSGSDPDFQYVRLPLAVGSLFWMTADLQATHKHAMKREVGAAERISVTLRRLTHASAVVTTPKW